MRLSLSSTIVPGVLVLAACGTDRAAPSQRDLTLMPAAESATPAVVSARELALPKPEPVTGDSRREPVRRPITARERGHEAQPADPVPAIAPAAVTAPVTGTAAPAEATPVETGAGRALTPGQVVTAIPASSATGPGRLPVSDASTLDGIRTRPVIIIGDDRCIPGRGEVIPPGLY